ncbi:glycosyltransferase family 50 protein [Atractiella rhizophila]|nr:glycosyltransferase family 50 protein [Atractiella rhizophila]
MNLFQSLLLAFLARFFLILYSIHHDAHSVLKYTDIDYRVFTDAAYFLLHPQNLPQNATERSFSFGDPYQRATYRYTPLLALLLTTNHLIHNSFGKFIFASCDLIIGYLIYKLLIKNVPVTDQKKRSKILWMVNLVWLWNPMIANISTRGSAESVLGVLVIGCLAAAETGRWNLAAIVLGVAVHFKIYPFIYASSLLSRIKREDDLRKGRREENGLFARFFCWRQVWFGIVSLTTFATLNGFMYSIWGYPFISHTYLYHLTRLDHRHNFSSYFYPIYLSFTKTLKLQTRGGKSTAA